MVIEMARKPLNKSLESSNLSIYHFTGYSGDELSGSQLNAVLLLLQKSSNPMGMAILNAATGIEIRNIMIKSFKETGPKKIEALIANHRYTISFPIENKTNQKEMAITISIDDQIRGRFGVISKK